MANTLYPPPRPQSVGEILDSAFRIFRATLVQCLPYAIAAVIAGQLPNIYYLVSGRNMLQGLAGFRDPVWVTLYFRGRELAARLRRVTRRDEQRALDRGTARSRDEIGRAHV